MCLLLLLPLLLLSCRSLGTRLLLSAVVSGMSATSAHLHAIMLVVRDLLASTHVRAPAARAAAAAPAAHGAADVPAAEAEALAASDGEEADEDASRSHSSSSSSVQQEEGVSAAGAAGLKPVEEWVFEDVDCKGAAAGEPDCRSASSSSSNQGLFKPDGKPAAGPAGGVLGGHPAAVGDTGSQQSPYMIFKGAAQMMAMLLVMYLLLEVLAAVYKGRSPAQQLLESLTQLKELLGIMLVPLAMMCLGGVLAVWQFGLNSTVQASERRQQQQRAASMTANAPASKAAAGKAAGLQEEGVGVAWT